MMNPVDVTSDDEIAFVKDIANGRPFLGNSIKSDEKRTEIRAELIRAVMLGLPVRLPDSEPEAVPVPCGVALYDCEIEDSIDLTEGGRRDGGYLPVLSLRDCLIRAPLILQLARLEGLYLDGSIISDVYAARAVVKGAVWLENTASFDPWYVIDFHDADISGPVKIQDMSSKDFVPLRSAVLGENADLMTTRKIIQLDEARIAGYAVIASNREDNIDYIVPTTISAECVNVEGDLIIRHVVLDDFYGADLAGYDRENGLVHLTRARVKALRMEHCRQALTDRLGVTANTLTACRAAKDSSSQYHFITYNCEGLIAQDRIDFVSAFGHKNLRDASTGVFFDDALAGEGHIGKHQKELAKRRSPPRNTDAPGPRLAQWLDAELETYRSDCQSNNNQLDIGNFNYREISYADLTIAPLPKLAKPVKPVTQSVIPGSSTSSGSATKPAASAGPSRPAKEAPVAAPVSRDDIRTLQTQALFTHVEGYTLKKGWFGDKIRFEGDPADYSPQVLMQLARIDYNAGDMDRYKLIMIQKNWNDLYTKNKRSGGAKLLSSTRWFHELLGTWFGFGYSPGKALATLFLYLVIGTIGVHVANASGMLVVNTQAVASTRLLDEIVVPFGIIESLDERNKPSAIPCGKSISPMFYALDTMIPFLDLHQEEKCEIKAEVNSSYTIPSFISDTMPAAFKGYVSGSVTVWWSLIWMLAYAGYAIVGWVITSLAILTFSGILRQKAD